MPEGTDKIGGFEGSSLGPAKDVLDGAGRCRDAGQEWLRQGGWGGS